MKTRNTAACLGILTACFAISNAAIAEDNCSGHSVGVGSARVVTMDDHNLPMHLAIGYCRETGKTSGQCTFSDKDHDEWTDAQEWHGTGTEGTWYTVSGTGKYEKAKGSSGWWKLVRSDGTVSIWAIGGNCKLVGQTQWGRNEAIRRARLEHGYSLSEIGSAARLHYSTVSRIVSREAGTLIYERSLSEDSKVVQIWERYVDWCAALLPLHSFRETFAGGFRRTIDRRRFTAFGTPSDQRRNVLDGFQATYMTPLGRFARWAHTAPPIALPGSRR